MSHQNFGNENWLLPCESLNGVVDGQDVDSLAVLDIGTGLDRDDVRKADPQVVANDAIHADLLVGACFIRENDADGFLAALSLQQNCVSSEQLQFVHLSLRQTNDRIIIVCGIVDDETVWAVLALQDCGSQVFVSVNKTQSVRFTSFHFDPEKITKSGDNSTLFAWILTLLSRPLLSRSVSSEFKSNNLREDDFC